MVYYSVIIHQKECIPVGSGEVDEPRACYTEWSKQETEKQILYINAYIQNLENWCWWTYLQGRKRYADVENRLWAEQGKERVGRIDRVALTYIHCHE